jgi:hypothetical protein
MEDNINLNEIYIHDSKLFKAKNLKSFIKNHKIQEHDMVKLKGNKIGIKRSWIKKNIPSFNLKLEEMSDPESINYFEVGPALEKYGCKTFNPISLNLDSTTVKYFIKEDKRTPYFTRKGLIKIMVLFNALQENIFDWMYELNNGCLQSQTNNLLNVSEMVNLNHTPIVKQVGGEAVLSNHIYNVNNQDIIVDFKRIGDLKKEPNLKLVLEDYKCPLYSQMQLNFEKSLHEAEANFNNKLKELKQEKVIQHLQQELDKEKSLKDQVLSLTQSFMPMSMINGDIKPSPSPYISNNSPAKTLSKLKPSKIQ